jgi:hypothetical protein
MSIQPRLFRKRASHPGGIGWSSPESVTDMCLLALSNDSAKSNPHEYPVLQFLSMVTWAWRQVGGSSFSILGRNLA